MLESVGVGDYFNMLQSTYIIENSSSPDTVIGRCKMVKTIHKQCSKQGVDNIKFQLALDQFKQTYYDRYISASQVVICGSTEAIVFDFFLKHITRSFYEHISKQFSEMKNMTSKKYLDTRLSKMRELYLNMNLEIITLFISSDSELYNRNLTGVSLWQKNIWNYIHLKQDGFSNLFIIKYNGKEYLDEDDAGLLSEASVLIKKIKSQLYQLQFEIINSAIKFSLIVVGVNVQLGFSDLENKELSLKIQKELKNV